MWKPTVGRQVHYFPLTHETSWSHTQPFPATITHVWNDNCVNLSVLNETGVPLHGKTSVMLVERSPQPGQCAWPART